MYENGEFQAMTLDDYADTVCRQLMVLPEEVIIQRVTGDGAKNDLIAPLWSLKKFCVMNEIDKKMARENLWQGMCIDKKYIHDIILPWVYAKRIKYLFLIRRFKSSSGNGGELHDDYRSTYFVNTYN